MTHNWLVSSFITSEADTGFSWADCELVTVTTETIQADHTPVTLVTLEFKQVTKLQTNGIIIHFSNLSYFLLNLTSMSDNLRAVNVN